MNYRKETGFYRSSNGHNDVAYYFYTPLSEEIKGIVQICHGMCEYLERYEDFINYLCSLGFAVCGNDLIGHGNSVNDDEELGFFAEKNGWICLAKDTLALTRMAKIDYPYVPYFLLGHSMGSLIVRTVLAKHSELYDGALILGTINIKLGADVCLAAVETVEKAKGKRFRTKHLDKILLDMSNARIKKPETEYDWICTDMNVVREYAADPRCTFTFTAQGMYDLVMLVKYVSSRGWAKKVRAGLPVLIASGAEDPVGSYGICPRDLFRRMTDAGTLDAELHIYPGMRHEILNEVNKREVYEDIGDWLCERIENERWKAKA